MRAVTVHIKKIQNKLLLQIHLVIFSNTVLTHSLVYERGVCIVHYLTNSTATLKHQEAAVMTLQSFTCCAPVLISLQANLPGLHIHLLTGTWTTTHRTFFFKYTVIFGLDRVCLVENLVSYILVSMNWYTSGGGRVSWLYREDPHTYSFNTINKIKGDQ